MPGKIVTFYSYKGGTGRSLSLANVAWILASQGKRVLCIDWDLEAPGLHRYFAPFLEDATLEQTAGLIDWFYEFIVAATTDSPRREAAHNGGIWFESYADLARVARPVKWAFDKGGEIDLVGAGKQSAGYADRVRRIDWDRFYEEYGGGAFLEHCASMLRGEYDYVLIDSRTGISDTSGICTIQMPDAVALFFTLNNQSMEGAAAIAKDILRVRRGTNARTVQLFPCATRIELSEKHKLEDRRKLVRSRFAPLIAESGTKLPKAYFELTELIYEPFYAYEEILATLADAPGRINSLLSALERLTGFLSDGEVTRLGALSDARRAEALRAFDASTAAGGEARVDVGANREPSDFAEVFDIYIVAEPSDLELAINLRRTVAAFCRPFLADVDLRGGDDWSARQAQARSSAAVVLVFVNSAVARAPRLCEEVDAAEGEGKIIVPICTEQRYSLHGTPLAALGRRQALTLSQPSELPVVAGLLQRMLERLGRVHAEVEDPESASVRELLRVAVNEREQSNLRRRFRLVFATAMGLFVALVAVFISSATIIRRSERRHLVEGEKLAQAVRAAAERAKEAASAQAELVAIGDALATPIRERLAALTNGIAQWAETSASMERVTQSPLWLGGSLPIGEQRRELTTLQSSAEAFRSDLEAFRAALGDIVLPQATKNSLMQQVGGVEGKRADVEQTITRIAHALAVREALPPGKQTPQEVWQQGVAALARKEHLLALRLFERALDLDPSYAPAATSIGGMAIDDNRYDEAEKWLRRAYEVDRKYAPAASEMARLLTARGDLTEAAKWTSLSLNANPEYAPASVLRERIRTRQAVSRPQPMASPIASPPTESDPSFRAHRAGSLRYDEF